MASTIFLSIVAIFLRSYFARKAQVTKVYQNTTTTTTGKLGGIGARMIQFACVAMIIPALIILALENILKGETIATIIGGLIGYVLSGISNFDKNQDA